MLKAHLVSYPAGLFVSALFFSLPLLFQRLRPGPTDNLGEGSVALSMSLLKKTRQPKNYSEAKSLDTGSQEMIVAAIPKSSKCNSSSSYLTALNITERVTDWMASHGYDPLQSFSMIEEACARKIGAVPTGDCDPCNVSRLRVGVRRKKWREHRIRSTLIGT